MSLDRLILNWVLYSEAAIPPLTIGSLRRTYYPVPSCLLHLTAWVTRLVWSAIQSRCLFHHSSCPQEEHMLTYWSHQQSAGSRSCAGCLGRNTWNPYSCHICHWKQNRPERTHRSSEGHTRCHKGYRGKGVWSGNAASRCWIFGVLQYGTHLHMLVCRFRAIFRVARHALEPNAYMRLGKL